MIKMNFSVLFCGWLHTVHVRCITLTVLSSDAVRSDCPSPEKSTLLTVAVWALNTVLSPFLQVTGKNSKLCQPLIFSSNCNNLLESDAFSIDQRYQVIKSSQTQVEPQVLCITKWLHSKILDMLRHFN